MSEKLVMKSAFGSVLYGTSTPTSDVDYKGIFIPDAKDLIMSKARQHYSQNTSNSHQKNTADDIDLEMFSLQYFIDMAIKGETIALDMIHTPIERVMEFGDMSYVWTHIRHNRSKFYTTDMKAYLGYVKRQAAKYGIKGSRLSALSVVRDWVNTLPETRVFNQEEFNADSNKRIKNIVSVGGEMHQELRIGEFFDQLPIDNNDHAHLKTVDGHLYYNVAGSAYQETLTVKRFKLSINKAWNSYGERARLAEQNQGVDWKSLHHAIRGGLQLKEIYSTGDLVYPLKDNKLLMDVKTGSLDFKVVAEILEDTISEVDALAKTAALNGMPEKVDRTFWDDFIFKIYSDHILENLSGRN